MNQVIEAVEISISIEIKSIDRGRGPESPAGGALPNVISPRLVYHFVSPGYHFFFLFPAFPGRQKNARKKAFKHAKKPLFTGVSEVFKLVAGAGFEPTTFRL